MALNTIFSVVALCYLLLQSCHKEFMNLSSGKQFSQAK